jgi:hypothetical protein
MKEGTSSAIIGIRVQPAVKLRLREVATSRGQTLSAFLDELIGAGWDVVVKHTGKEGPGKNLLNEKDSGSNQIDPSIG